MDALRELKRLGSRFVGGLRLLHGRAILHGYFANGGGVGGAALAGVFEVKGWNEAVGRIIEMVLTAESAEAARQRAESMGLKLVVVTPYAPRPAGAGTPDESGTSGDVS